MAIQSFASQQVERFYRTGKPPKKAGWLGASRIATRKLDMLHYAERLTDLRSPPGNRLKSLKGDLQDLYSIRINNQWRIVFRWTPTGPTDVDILDYH